MLRLWVVEIGDRGRGLDDRARLLSGEWVLVLKPLTPHRFSVVVFTDPQERDHGHQARRRDAGGHSWSACREPGRGQWCLRGAPHHDQRRSPTTSPMRWYPGHGIVQTVTVPKDAYFVLGDNRDDSVDSRRYRADARRAACEGVAVAVVYPFSHLRMIDRKPNRPRRCGHAAEMKEQEALDLPALFLLIAISLGAFGQISLKYGMKQFGPSISRISGRCSRPSSRPYVLLGLGLLCGQLGLLAGGALASGS